MATKLEHISEDTRDELATLALRMSSNKATRPGFLGLVKQVAPDTPIPELDTDSKIEAAIRPVIERAEKAERDLSDFRLQNDLSARKNGVREKHGLSDEDFKKIEERMGKKELPMDYEFAARLYKQETESAAPTNYGTSGFGSLAIEEGARAFEGLLDNEQKWSLHTAHNMVDDMLKNRNAGKF